MNVAGELREDGSFTATGTGTVAGFPGIKVEFTGSLTADGLTGEYTMGVGGGLPTDQSITYRIEGQKIDPPAVETLDAFIQAFVPALQFNDAAFLLDRLHPAVLELYGAETCQSTLAQRKIDPTYDIEVLSSSGPGPWAWEVDGRTTPIAEVYTIDAIQTREGEKKARPMHLGQVDGRFRWFTDCGDPLP